MPRPGVEPGLEVPETSVMSFSLPGRRMRQGQNYTSDTQRTRRAIVVGFPLPASGAEPLAPSEVGELGTAPVICLERIRIEKLKSGVGSVLIERLSMID